MLRFFVFIATTTAIIAGRKRVTGTGRLLCLISFKTAGWIGRSIMDSHFRTICGLPAPMELNSPLYLFDASNAKEAGTPADYDNGYGGAHVQGFRDLWDT